MEQKKSKVLTVDRFSKADNFGNWSFNIKFENGDEGFYRTKFEDQNYFRVNAETDYNIENKTSQAGKEWFKVTRVEVQKDDDTPPQLQSSGTEQRDYDFHLKDKKELKRFEQKAMSCTIILSYVNDDFRENKITKEEVGPLYQMYLKLALKEIDKI